MSTFFQSDQVQSNLQDIFNTYQEIAVMSQHLSEMSKEQRLEHIEDCKYLIVTTLLMDSEERVP